MEVVVIVDVPQLIKLVSEGGVGAIDFGAILIAYVASKHYFNLKVHEESYHYLPTKELRNKAMEKEISIYKKKGKDFASVATILLILSPILVVIVIIICIIFRK